MLRATFASTVNNRISSEFTHNEWVGIKAVVPQAVRWIRKPIWLPQSKSKLLRVPPRVRAPKDEEIEIRRLYNNYRTYRKSIKEYLVQMTKANQVQFDEESMRKAEEVDFKNCSHINAEWNKEREKHREIRLEQNKEALILKVGRDLEKRDQKEQLQMVKIDAAVRQAKIDSLTFITPETIDQAIQEALVSYVDYNAAIDTNGKWYRSSDESVKVQESV